ncbi:MAG TPA: FtsX-like permease family protein, partial [Thermoanaerobaculia bacterium]|nr:FtsX-like permease family protein [Thermoanaerobaculia bacterium]
ETALRVALGAGRRDLVRQALAESLPPALAGGALGFLLGIWGTRLLLAAAPPLARPAEIAFEPRGLLFALAACMVVAFLAGLAPALQDAGALREGRARTAGPGGPRGARVLALLVALEVALSLPLLTGAGLLGRSLAHLSSTPLGFTDQGVVTLRLEPPPARYAGTAELGAFYDRLLARVAAVPGVRAAGLTSSLPLSGLYAITLNVSLEDGERPVEAGYRGVSPGYFAALRIPLRSGRLPGSGDGPDSAKVALVNESFARAAWPASSAIQAVGRSILLTGAAGMVSREVIGVVGDVRHAGPAEEPRPEIYVPYSQSPLRFATLAARTDRGPEAVLAAVRSAVWEVDRDLALAGVQPLERIVEAATARPRFHRLLAGVLAAVAVALAATGLFGVTAWSVTRRTREIGVRLALGADRGRVVRGVLRGALAPVLAGLVLGLAASLALTRLLAGLLHDVAPTDPVTLSAAPLLLLLIAVAAALLPARRAARTDPAAGLRAE